MRQIRHEEGTEVNVRTLSDDLVDVLPLPQGHVAEVGEDDEPREQTRERVYTNRRQAIPESQNTTF